MNLHIIKSVNYRFFPSSADVGLVSNPTLDDLAEIMPIVSRSLKDILEYEGDVEEDLMLNFEASLVDSPLFEFLKDRPGVNFIKLCRQAPSIKTVK